MWIPTPIYERIPQFWLLMGLMFFAFGLYLGFEYQLIFAYLALGALCIARSIWVGLTRRTFRTKAFDAELAQRASKKPEAAEAGEERETADDSEGVPSY